MQHQYFDPAESRTGANSPANGEHGAGSGDRHYARSSVTANGRHHVQFEEFQGTRAECLHCALQPFCSVSNPSESRPATFGQQVVRKGMVMFRQGEPVEGVFAVCHGGVKRAHSERLGEEEVLSIVGPGRLFGNEDLTKENHLTTATVLQDGVVGFLSRKTVEDEIGKNPAFSRELYRSLADWNWELVHRSSDLSKGSSRLRLARALLRLSDQYGLATADGIRLTIPLQRREIAGLIGTEPETVTRLLGALFEERVLRELRRGEFLILDEHRMRRMARL